MFSFFFFAFFFFFGGGGGGVRRGFDWSPFSYVMACCPYTWGFLWSTQKSTFHLIINTHTHTHTHTPHVDKFVPLSLLHSNYLGGTLNNFFFLLRQL